MMQSSQGAKRALTKTLKYVLLICSLCLATATVTAEDIALTIDPASGTYAAGDVFDVAINVDASGLTLGDNAIQTIQIALDIGDKLEMWDKDSGSASIAYGKAIKVDPAWDGQPPPGTPKQDGNVVTFGGAVTGSDGLNGLLKVADVTFHVKDGAADGAAPVTFEPSAGNFLDGTFALSVSFAELTSTLTGASYTIGGEVLPDYDFDADAEGWLFSGALADLTAPTESVSDSCLHLQSANNTNTFGFWYSPRELPLEADMLYRAQFGVKSDQTDKSVVPTFRIRWNSDNEKQSDMVSVRSSGDGEASPDTTVQDYDLYFQPQGEALAEGNMGYFSFDMANIDPNDAAAATLSLDYVHVDRTAVPTGGDLTAVQTYTFDTDPDGWTESGQMGAFTPPIFSHEEIGALKMACDNNNATYGYWQNPQEAITLDGTVVYKLRVNAGTAAGEKTLQNEPPRIRIRMYDHPDNQMMNVFQTPVWTEYTTPSGGKTSQVIYSDFYSYFINPLGQGPSLGIAVDIVNFEEGVMDPNGIVEINEVEISTFAVPSF